MPAAIVLPWRAAVGAARLANPDVVPGNVVDLGAALPAVDLDRKLVQLGRDRKFVATDLIRGRRVSLAVQLDRTRPGLGTDIVVGQRKVNRDVATLSEELIGAVERRVKIAEGVERALPDGERTDIDFRSPACVPKYGVSLAMSASLAAGYEQN